MEKETIIVDGANIAWEDQTRSGKPKTANIRRIHEALVAKGFRPVIIVDAALQHKIDDADGLERMIDDKTVLQAPAGTDADYFILETARREDARIVTNDTYRDWRDQFCDLKERLVPVMIVNGTVELYEPKLDPDFESRSCSESEQSE